MNVLYLVPHVPNPTKARSYHQILGLLDAGHEVFVATLWRSAEDARSIEHLRAMGVPVIAARLTKVQSAFNSLLAMPSQLPLQVAFMRSGRLMDALKGHLHAHPPDVVHVEHLRMAPYGLQLVQDWPVVWDAVDHLASLHKQASSLSASRAWQLIAGLEAPRLERYERWLTGKFPATMVISKEDQRLFQQDNPYASRIHVVPPGLPLSQLADPPQRVSDTLIITGTLDYHPNVASVIHFVNEVLPMIRRQRPDVRLQLVGARPLAAVQELSSSHVEVTGFVPSLTDYLQKATVALAPVLYGSGVQNKVIEAFFTETPLVATSVALRGLDVRDGEHVLVANTPASFSDAVLRLLDDPDGRARLGRAGRRYLEQNHDLVTTTQRLVDVYLAVLSQNGGSDTHMES